MKKRLLKYLLCDIIPQLSYQVYHFLDFFKIHVWMVKGVRFELNFVETFLRVHFITFDSLMNPWSICPNKEVGFRDKNISYISLQTISPSNECEGAIWLYKILYVLSS